MASRRLAAVVKLCGFSLERQGTSCSKSASWSVCAVGLTSSQQCANSGLIPRCAEVRIVYRASERGLTAAELNVVHCSKRVHSILHFMVFRHFVTAVSH